VGTHYADKTAECGHCGRRCVLHTIEETLRYHKLPDKSAKCPGTSTWDYSKVDSAAQTLLRVVPAKITGPRAFRFLSYENWLNRWERKFGVKIPDKNIKILTNGKFKRRSSK